MEKHGIEERDAAKILEWIRTRGGILVWSSINLSNPGATWTTPVRGEDGSGTAKPNWQCGSNPRLITNAADVEVVTYSEVKRFRIALRMGAGGLTLKLTDGSQRKLDRALTMAGEESRYRFDYDTQEAVIYVPGGAVSLDQMREVIV